MHEQIPTEVGVLYAYVIEFWHFLKDEQNQNTLTWITNALTLFVTSAAFIAIVRFLKKITKFVILLNKRICSYLRDLYEIFVGSRVKRSREVHSGIQINIPSIYDASVVAILIFGLSIFFIGKKIDILMVSVLADSGGVSETMRRYIPVSDEIIYRSCEVHTIEGGDNLALSSNSLSGSKERIRGGVDNYYSDNYEKLITAYWRIDVRGEDIIKLLNLAAEYFCSNPSNEDGITRYSEVEEYLSQAESQSLIAAERDFSYMDRYIRQAAEIRILRAEILLLLNNYLDSSSHYMMAYDLIKEIDSDVALDYLLRSASILIEIGGDRNADNSSIANGIQIIKNDIEPRVDRDSLPDYWVQYRLKYGIALRLIGERNNESDSLYESIKVFEGIIEYLNSKRPLNKRDRTNLFITYFEIAWAEGAYGWDIGNIDRMNAAISYYERALERVDRNRNPAEWAIVNQRIAIIYRIVGQYNREYYDNEWSGSAIISISNARNSIREIRNSFPYLWSDIMVSSGVIEWAISIREKDNEKAFAHIRNSITYYTSALLVYDDVFEKEMREERPFKWAVLMMNYGNVLLERGVRGLSSKDILDAIESYDRSLSIWSKEESPLHWALVRQFRAMALIRLSEFDEYDNLDEAIEDSYIILDMYNDHNENCGCIFRPIETADVYYILATAMMIKFTNTNDREYIEKAHDYAKISLDIYTDKGHIGAVLSEELIGKIKSIINNQILIIPT